MAKPIVPPEVLAKVSNFNNAEWVSTFSSFIKDDVYPTLIERYGYGDRIFDYIDMANQTTTIRNRQLRVFEEGTMEATIKIGTAIATGAAGANITFKVDVDDIDANGNVPVRASDNIIIPGVYQTSGEDRGYRISTITKNSAVDVDIVAVPYNNAGTFATAAQIGMTVPADTILCINGGQSGIGTGQPDGKTRSWFERTYETSIIKESVNYEGGVGGYQSWIDSNNWAFKDIGGGKSVAAYLGTTQMEFDFMKKKAASVFFSETNDNTALTETSQSNGTNAIPSTKGIWNWAEEAGQDLVYSNTFDIEDMADVRDLLRAQLVTCTDVMFWTGPTLDRQIEAANLGYTQSYSGGSDLIKNMENLGVRFKSFLYNGLTFNFKSCADFENVQRYGGDAYDFVKRGLMYPMTTGKTRFGNQESEMTPNFLIGYMEDNGVRRENILRILDGMTGISDVAVNEFDARNVYMLSELANIVLRPNQLIRVLPE